MNSREQFLEKIEELSSLTKQLSESVEKYCADVRRNNPINGRILTREEVMYEYIIYSKDDCTQCLQLESLLRAKGKNYFVKKLDKDYTRDELAKLFQTLGKPMPRSFPMLFRKGEYIGTLNDAKLLIVRGQL